MEAGQFSVHVLKCPFGVRSMQFMSGAEWAPPATVLFSDDRYAHVSRDAGVNGASPRNSYAVAGTRGIQHLVAARVPPTTPHGPQADLFSMHSKGRLLLWNSHTGSLVASHAFNPAFMVHQCVMAGTCVYTTLEGSPDTAGAEEERSVYVWERRTLQSVTVLRGHEGRLTALAVAPSSNTEQPAAPEVVLATASLDGTVRLWQHRQLATPDENADETARADLSPVQVLAVLPAGELGVIHGLCFLTADVLVAACSKCALAFVRLSDVMAKNGSKGNGAPKGRMSSAGVVGPRWQLLRSSVDPDGSTTALHVCPSSATDNRKLSSMSNGNGVATTATATAAANTRHASLIKDVRRRRSIVTGSSSGYLQEWVVEICDGDTHQQQQQPQEPQEPEEGSPALTIAGVLTRSRWHNKTHAATVDCIVTDDDIVVSTSIFDGARLYHRRIGFTCAITTAAVVPVLVPQLKQLIWGSVDGSLSVASYAAFASGTERELQLLWACRPHAAAIRAMCLSLTSTLQWKTLCVGAADGSTSVWRPAAAPAPPPVDAAKQQGKGKAVAPALSRVLDVYVASASHEKRPSYAFNNHGSTTSAGVAATATAATTTVTVVGLTREANGIALAIAELNAESGAMASFSVLPLQPQQASEVTCARLYCSAETNHRLNLFVGTRGGHVLRYVKEIAATASRAGWRALEPCKWTATNSNRCASVTAISSLRSAPHGGGALLAVTSQSTVATSLATQRILISVLRTHVEKGTVAMEGNVAWEGFVDMSTSSQDSLVSVTSSNNQEPGVVVEWLAAMMVSDPKLATGAAGARAAAAATANGLLVRNSRGMLLRCRYVTSDNAANTNDVMQTWAAPEALTKPTSSPEHGFAGIAPALDYVNAEVLVTDSDESDIVCVNVATGRKRVFMKAATRASELGSVLCDAGTTAVRLAAVRLAAVRHGSNGVGNGGNSADGGTGSLAEASLVSLYDNEGREQYRVAYDGAISSCTPTAAMASAKKPLSFALSSATASSRSSPARPASAAAAACTLLAASAVDRLLFIGYEDGLVQLLDTTDMFVFMRTWVTDEAGALRAVREVHYAKGVALVQLSNNCVRTFVVPPRSILDQPMPL